MCNFRRPEVCNFQWPVTPPTRGSRAGPVPGVASLGSIPAHTGKPTRGPSSARPPTVYPRPHGEAVAPDSQVEGSTGLSPPTRGSRADEVPGRLRPRSIPAHTGKPCRAPTACRRRPVSRRSIPAHTGKPRTRRRASGAGGVYPRPHGEAAETVAKAITNHGLSPPTRGSRRVADLANARVRSIPAHTGKPSGRRRCRRSGWVYPRPHGEASGRRCRR